MRSCLKLSHTGPMPNVQAPPTIIIMSHDSLAPGMLASLRLLFDREYCVEHGEWDPDQPYGYAPHDLHVIAFSSGEVVGHVGWARRTITVNEKRMMIAGVGGVLVSPEGRGQALGSRLMDAAADAMRTAGDIEFGYLGCDESVVPFYTSCGWQRIRAQERCVGRDGVEADTAPGPPLLILPVAACQGEGQAIEENVDLDDLPFMDSVQLGGGGRGDSRVGRVVEQCGVIVVGQVRDQRGVGQARGEGTHECRDGVTAHEGSGGAVARHVVG